MGLKENLKGFSTAIGEGFNSRKFSVFFELKDYREGKIIFFVLKTGAVYLKLKENDGCDY